MKRTASAKWTGDLKQGKGMLTTQSGVLKDTAYGFSTRFENSPGTNPEELIAAAHAGCFTMALSAFLGKAGFTPQSLATQAALTLEQVQGNWTITAIHLDLVGLFQASIRVSLTKLPLTRRRIARYHGS